MAHQAERSYPTRSTPDSNRLLLFSTAAAVNTPRDLPLYYKLLSAYVPSTLVFLSSCVLMDVLYLPSLCIAAVYHSVHIIFWRVFLLTPPRSPDEGRTNCLTVLSLARWACCDILFKILIASSTLKGNLQL